MKKANWIPLTIWALALVLALNLVGATFVAAAFAQTTESQNNAPLAFQRLKALAGTWEAETKMGRVLDSFEVASGGSAVLERMKAPRGHEMITVYYLDGYRLLLTHYCEAGNQPRMEAKAFDPNAGVIDFRFLDATNLPNQDTGHMHREVITLDGQNEVSERWTFYKDGKPAFTEPLQYHRIN